MEKKVRYLMLLLCLFLFPFRVYALDEPIEDTELNTNESSTIVVKDTGYTNDNQMDQTDPETVSKEDETEPAGEEEQPATPEVGNTTEPTTGTENPVVEGDNTRKALLNNNLDTNTNGDEVIDGNSNTLLGNSNTNQADGNVVLVGDPNELVVGDTEPVGVKQIVLSTVNTKLTIGESFGFSAKVADSAPYKLKFEEWESWSSPKEYRANAATRNEELSTAGKTVSDDVVKPYKYEYNVGITFDEGYDLEWSTAEEDGYSYDYIDFQVNDSSVEGDIISYNEETNTYYFKLKFTVDPFNPNYSYIEPVEMSNVTEEAYIGQAPSYTASLDTAQAQLEAEYWYWVEKEVINKETGEEKKTLHINITNQALTEFVVDAKDADENVTFDTFEGGQEYYHGFLISLDPDVLLDYTPEAESPYQVVINGKEVKTLTYLETFDGNRAWYYVEFYDEITPVEAPVQEESNNDVVATVTDYRYDSNDDGNGAVNLTLTTEKKDDSKLEVKKDDKEKEQEKEKTKENSNIGLIIFLIILVIIAIAIPVTIYKKKQ